MSDFVENALREHQEDIQRVLVNFAIILLNGSACAQTGNCLFG